MSTRLRRLLPPVALIALILLGVLFLGEELAHHLEIIDAWLASLGSKAFVGYLVVFVGCVTLFVPSSLLGFIAGGFFGFWQGVVLVFAGGLFAGLLQYLLARRFVSKTVLDFVRARSALSWVPEAVRRDGLKLQVLLRLTPLNPAAINYLLGAVAVDVRGFMLAMLAALPHTLGEVFLGVAGKHLLLRAGGSPGGMGNLTDLLALVGAIATVAILVALTRYSAAAVRRSMPPSTDVSGDSLSSPDADV